MRRHKNCDFKIQFRPFLLVPQATGPPLRTTLWIKTICEPFAKSALEQLLDLLNPALCFLSATPEPVEPSAEYESEKEKTTPRSAASGTRLVFVYFL